MEVAIKEYQTSEFILTEAGEFKCAHDDVQIERACCSGHDSEGNPSCACHGQDAVWCPAQDCTGIEDWEVENLLERFNNED